MDESTKKSISFEGTVASAVLSGEGTFTIETDGLICALPFDDAGIDFADITAIRFEDYAVHVTANEAWRFYNMGQQAQWLYDKLFAAYNARVLSALNVDKAALLKANGVCDGSAACEVRVFDDCVVILPPDKGARRLPFVFLNGMKNADYALSLSLTSAEHYTLSMLGYDLVPLEAKITEAVKAQREQNRKFLTELCGQMGMTELANASRRLPEGVAAPLASLPNALASVLIAKAKNSKMGAYFEALRSVCDASALAIGIKALDTEKVEELKAKLLEKLNENAETEVTLTPEQEDALKWIVWVIAPSADGSCAVVEFAFPDEGAATYVFRTDGSPLLSTLNRGLEATGLAREVFSAPTAKLTPDMRMLIDRTPAVAVLRERYVGKAIHSNVNAWKKSVAALMCATQEKPAAATFCGMCGAKLVEGTKFCGQCGAALMTK